MSHIKTYNYPKLIKSLNAITTTNQSHESAIAQIIYGLENQHRVHWINDALTEDGLPTVYTILDFYHITY